MKEFVEKLIGRLEEKFKYNSEQAEIWRNGSDKDAFFREKKDLYMDRANTYGEVMRIANQLAEEYKDEELRKSQQIYNFIKREINPYGKPFEGTVYEFGLKVMKYIRNLSTEEYNNDFCEWSKQGGYNFYLHKTSCGTEDTFDDSYVFCPYCGKKIKVVELWNTMDA